MAGNEIQRDVKTKTELCALSGNLRPIDHNRDIWKDIALRLDRSSLCKLICSWKWFAVAVVTDDSLWKELLLRDLGVTTPVGVGLDLEDVSWKETYATVFKAPPTYNPIYINDYYQIAGARLGGIIMSSSVWMGADHLLNIEELNQHGYFVSNLIPGLWVAEVYTGTCPVCEDACKETTTILSLWHSKLYLMGGFEGFCPNIMTIKYTDSRIGVISCPSAASLDLANLATLSSNIGALNLHYKVSGQGVAVEFTDNEEKIMEAEFKVTRDSDGRAVTIQIEHIGHHLRYMAD